MSASLPHPDVIVSGEVAPGYEAVREAFQKNFELGKEVGASVAVYRYGKPVVDLWGGHLDAERRLAWTRDSATVVYSATKGATATLFHLLHQAGEFDLDCSVATYWPEFGCAGKEATTVRQLLSHQAGLPALDSRLPLKDLLSGSTVAEHLARQSPLWRPGASHGYHALTFGWLCGELVQRISGRSLGDLFAERIARPLGLDFWIGLPSDRRENFAPLVDGTPVPNELDSITDPLVRAAILRVGGALSDPTSLFSRVLTTNGALPTPHASTWNEPALLATEQPAANGIANGRALARMYAACLAEVDGVRLLNDETLDSATAEQCSGEDAVLLSFSRFATGYQLAQPAIPMIGPSSFGHAGAGGAIGFADRESGIAFGYAQNLLGASIVNERRATDIVDALKQAVGL